MRIIRTYDQKQQYGALAIHELNDEVTINPNFYNGETKKLDVSVSSLLTIQNEINAIHKEGQFDAIADAHNYQAVCFVFRDPLADTLVEFTFKHHELIISKNTGVEIDLIAQLAKALSATLVDNFGKSIVDSKHRSSIWLKLLDLFKPTQ